MFGDKLIIGESKILIGNKNRIILPKFTFVAEGDELVFKDEKDSIKIYLFQQYFNIIKRYQELLNNADTIEEYELYTQKIENICEQMKALVTVDKQRRIILPQDIVKTRNWNEGTTLIAKGLGNCLLLKKYNSKEF